VQKLTNAMQKLTVAKLQSNHNTAPSDMRRPHSLSSHERLWTEIPYYTAGLLWFTTTLNITPLMAVNKQWHYIKVWL